MDTLARTRRERDNNSSFIIKLLATFLQQMRMHSRHAMRSLFDNAWWTSSKQEISYSAMKDRKLISKFASELIALSSEERQRARFFLWSRVNLALVPILYAKSKRRAIDIIHRAIFHDIVHGITQRGNAIGSRGAVSISCTRMIKRSRSKKPRAWWNRVFPGGQPNRGTSLERVRLNLVPFFVDRIAQHKRVHLFPGYR